MISLLVSCAFIGDSIAQGLWQVNHKCINRTKVGASSTYILKNYSAPLKANTVVISMGSNDPYNPKLKYNAMKLRANVTGKVVWVLPRNSTAAKVILSVAAHYNDITVPLSNYPSNDGVHPKSYKQIFTYVSSLK